MRIFTIAAAVLAAAVASDARAADLGGSLKDRPATYDAPRDPGGFAIRVFLGYSTIDREYKQNNSGEIGLNHTPKCQDETEAPAIESSEGGETPSCEEVGKGATEFADKLNAHGIDASWNGTTFNLPILRVLSAVAGDEDLSSLSGGAEAEYMVYQGRFAFGLAVGMTFYGNADSTLKYSGAPISLGAGALFSPHGMDAEDYETDATASGFVKAERQYDIDVKFKAGFEPVDDWLFYGFVGPSFAKAKVGGGVGIDGTDLAMTYEDDDTAIGLVVGGGIQHRFDAQWSFNIEADWKKHKFGADKQISETLPLGDDSELYASAKSASSIEDSVWTIKAGVAHHW